MKNDPISFFLVAFYMLPACNPAFLDSISFYRYTFCMPVRSIGREAELTSRRARFLEFLKKVEKR